MVVGAGERMQGASWCYRGAEAGCRPAGAIDALRLWAGGYGCRGTGAGQRWLLTR